METVPFNRNSAVSYALRWALRRNPQYYDFSDLGGDCTSFISQCVFAGSGIMNFTPVFGWYYLSSYDRSPAWAGVDFFYDFMISNKGIGPYAVEISREDAETGDVVQFAPPGSTRFTHSLIITKIINGNRPIILVCAHSDDAFMRPLSTYRYGKIRFLHIEGVRKENVMLK